MDDTQKDGSDSDWDSTLDFTSPRQPIGNFMPRMQDEIEDEESALSNESDVDEANIDASVQEKNSVNTERNCKYYVYSCIRQGFLSSLPKQFQRSRSIL